MKCCHPQSGCTIIPVPSSIKQSSCTTQRLRVEQDVPDAIRQSGPQQGCSKHGISIFYKEGGRTGQECVYKYINVNQNWDTNRSKNRPSLASNTTRSEPTSWQNVISQSVALWSHTDQNTSAFPKRNSRISRQGENDDDYVDATRHQQSRRQSLHVSGEPKWMCANQTRSIDTMTVWTDLLAFFPVVMKGSPFVFLMFVTGCNLEKREQPALRIRIRPFFGR